MHGLQSSDFAEVYLARQTPAGFVARNRHDRDKKVKILELQTL